MQRWREGPRVASSSEWRKKTIESYMKRGKKLYEVYVATRGNAEKLVARRRREIASERIAKSIDKVIARVDCTAGQA